MNTLPTLPESITVEISGQPLVIEGKPNKEGSRIWYEEKGLVPELVAPDAVVPALAAIAVTYEGNALNAGEVHVSAPSKYRKGHEKQGQVVPNTGGNQTVTHSSSITLTDEGGKEFGYTLMVTVTYLDGKGFKINAKALSQTQSTKVISGLSFAAVA